MDIQTAIQQAIGVLRKAENKIIKDRDNFDIINDIWKVLCIMNAIHSAIHYMPVKSFVAGRSASNLNDLHKNVSNDEQALEMP